MNKKENTFDNLDLSIGILGGVGAFTLAKCAAKAFIKSKNPFIGVGLFIFEATVACKTMAEASSLSRELRNGAKETAKKVKTVLDEEVEDDEPKKEEA